MGESNIDTRTPEEMLTQAYNRIISIARAVTKGYDHNYLFGTLYVFAHDPKSFYSYGGWKQRDEYPDERMIVFRRESDNKMLTMTIFSEPPVKHAGL